VSRIEELDGLVRLRLKADDDESLIDMYQFALREIRPSADEFDYIDREISSRRAAQLSGSEAPPSASTYLPAQDVIDTFRRATPMSRLYSCINSLMTKWQDDSQDPIKAYIMACFSELAYLHLTDVELAARDRYKIFEPSICQTEIFRRRLRLDLTQIMPSTADIPIQIIQVGRFVFLVAQVNAFVVIAVRGTVVTSLREWMIDFEALKIRRDTDSITVGSMTRLASLCHCCLMRSKIGSQST
jgi:hypothetical protein